MYILQHNERHFCLFIYQAIFSCFIVAAILVFRSSLCAFFFCARVYHLYLPLILYKNCRCFHASECVEMCFDRRALVTWCANNCREEEKKNFINKKTVNIIHFASFHPNICALSHNNTFNIAVFNHFICQKPNVRAVLSQFRFIFNGMQQCSAIFNSIFVVCCVIPSAAFGRKFLCICLSLFLVKL